MVAGGDGNAQGQLTMVGGAYGLESNRSGRRWGPGVPSKCCHNVDARGEGGRWAAVGTCQHGYGTDVRAVERPK